MSNVSTPIKDTLLPIFYRTHPYHVAVPYASPALQSQFQRYGRSSLEARHYTQCYKLQPTHSFGERHVRQNSTIRVKWKSSGSTSYGATSYQLCSPKNHPTRVRASPYRIGAPNLGRPAAAMTLRMISFVTIPAIDQPESTINMESNTPQIAHDGRFSIRSAFDCRLAHICSEAWEAYLKTYKPLF